MTIQYALLNEVNDREVKARAPRARLPEQRGQLKMFSDGEVLQFGVNAHPLIPLSESMTLPMLHEDLDRETPEQKEARMQREAEKNTIPMFGPPAPPAPPEDDDPPGTLLPAYNGWPNKPTWSVFTWITNDEDTYDDALSAIAENPDSPADALQNFVAFDLLGPMMDNPHMETGTGLGIDLLCYILEFVDWHRIAEFFT